MYAYLFTMSLQGEIFGQFRDMIQVITKSTPDVCIICTRSMFKVASQEFVGQNGRHTYGIATASVDSCGSMCTDKQTHGSKKNDTYRSTCMYVQGITRMDVYTKSKGLHGSTCPDISNKYMGVHGGTSKDIST